MCMWVYIANENTLRVCNKKKVLGKKSKPPAVIVLVIQEESASYKFAKAMAFVMAHFIDMGFDIAHKHIGKSLSVEIYLLFPRSATKPTRLICSWLHCKMLCALQPFELTFENLYLHSWWKLTKLHTRVLIAFSMHVALCDPTTDRKCSSFDVDAF